MGFKNKRTPGENGMLTTRSGGRRTTTTPEQRAEIKPIESDVIELGPEIVDDDFDLPIVVEEKSAGKDETPFNLPSEPPQRPARKRQDTPTGSVATIMHTEDNIADTRELRERALKAAEERAHLGRAKAAVEAAAGGRHDTQPLPKIGTRANAVDSRPNETDRLIMTHLTADEIRSYTDQGDPEKFYPNMVALARTREAQHTAPLAITKTSVTEDIPTPPQTPASDIWKFSDEELNAMVPDLDASHQAREIKEPYDWFIAAADLPEKDAFAENIEAHGEIPDFISYAATTTQGGPLSKKHNEDTFVAMRAPDGSFVLSVIDGSSDSGTELKTKEPPGYIAARAASGALVDRINQETDETLREIFGHLNQTVAGVHIWKNETDPKKRGYACGAAIRIAEKTGSVELVGAGDSRAFLFDKDGRLKTATDMQNYATVRANGNTEQALEDTDFLSRMTNGIGIHPSEKLTTIIPRIYTEMSYKKADGRFGDIALVISDGVGDVISETELSGLVQQYGEDPNKLQKEILSLAYTRNNIPEKTTFEIQKKDGDFMTRTSLGKGDNITVAVARLSDSKLTEARAILQNIIAEGKADEARLEKEEEERRKRPHVQVADTPDIYDAMDKEPPQQNVASQTALPGPTRTGSFVAPKKQSGWKRAGKWAAGIAAAGLAVFGLKFGSDKRDIETEEPPIQTMTQVDTPRLAPEVAFTDEEVRRFDVDAPIETAQLSREQIQAAVEGARQILERAIDTGHASSEQLRTQLQSEIATSTSEYEHTARVIDAIRGHIEQFTQALNAERWGELATEMQTITQQLREGLTQTSSSGETTQRAEQPHTERRVRQERPRTGHESEAVQRALEHTRARHEAHGGDEGHETRMTQILTDVRGEIVGRHVRDTARDTAESVERHLVDDLSTVAETPLPLQPIVIPPPDMRRYAPEPSTLRTEAEPVPVPAPHLGEAPSNIEQENPDDEVYELNEEDLEEVVPPTDVPDTTRTLPTPQYRLSDAQPIVDRNALSTVNETTPERVPMFTNTDGEEDEDSLPEVTPIPEQTPPTVVPTTEKPSVEAKNGSQSQVDIHYLNTRTGLTLEKIASQYPNGISNLSPTQIRDLRRGLRANSPTLIDWIRINRVFESMLRGE